MNTITPAGGFTLAMEVVNTFPPKYWKKIDYGFEQYIIKFVEYSNEFEAIVDEVETAQLIYGTDYPDRISAIYRVQNPYTYARFMLRKKHMKLAYGYVYQARKYKLVPKKDVNLVLKYNCDGRRLGKADGDYVFYGGIPNVWDTHVLIVVQVLTSYDDEEEDDILCDRDSEFYIEYVVHFDN